MTKTLVWTVLAALCLFGGAVQAQTPTFGGSWDITGYTEPALTSPYSWCFDFTTTGTVLYPNSGTWNVPSYGYGWSGTWYQVGEEVIFHGVADGIYIFSWKGHIIDPNTIGGRQVEFFSDGSTDTAGTFRGTKVASCGGGASIMKRDPAR